MIRSLPDLCDQYPQELTVLEPLFTDFGKRLSFHGEIVTVSCFEDNSRVKELVGTDGAGRVIVVDGAGSLQRALLGDMLAARAAENDWQGLLINGCVRDVEILESIELGIKALDAYPVKTEKRDQGSVNVPIAFAGAIILPGHYLYADANGVAVSARELELEF